jgi:replication initiation and membrane attachment protein DnaB
LIQSHIFKHAIHSKIPASKKANSLASKKRKEKKKKKRNEKKKRKEKIPKSIGKILYGTPSNGISLLY